MYLDTSKALLKDDGVIVTINGGAGVWLAKIFGLERCPSFCYPMLLPITHRRI
jgi:hypothetical protein